MQQKKSREKKKEESKVAKNKNQGHFMPLLDRTAEEVTGKGARGGMQQNSSISMQLGSELKYIRKVAEK